MISVEQWRASIGLYRPHFHQQRSRIPGEKQLALTPFYHLIVAILLALILAKVLVCCALIVIWIWINGYSLLKGGLTHIMASKNRTSCIQLLVYVCVFGLAVLDANSGCLERSAKAMAILLIMAGDVEENPGPIGQRDLKTVSKYLRDLSQTDLVSLGLALGLYLTTIRDYGNVPSEIRRNLICDWIVGKDDVKKCGGTTWSSLVNALRDEEVNQNGIADKIEAEQIKGHQDPEGADEFTKGDTERCTLNPSPAELSSDIKTHHSSQIPPQPLHPQPSQHPSQSSYSHPQHPHNLSHPCPHPNLDPYNFEQFQMHLTHSQSPHLHPPPTKQLQHSPPHPVPQSPFLLFVSFLRSFYNSNIPLSYCKWPPVPKKKYINLAAISREKVTSKELKQFMLATLHGNVDQILETKAPVKLQEILQTEPGKMLHCILVEGAPGVGKTTLSWEICKKWAREELFQQYTAVLLLKLRDLTVQNAKNVMDLIHYMYDNDDEDCTKNISHYLIETKGKDILIILEGLDELPKYLLKTDQPSIFTRLLSRTVLPDATILVTSRPSATAQLRKGWEISRHIEVLGFTEKDITKYIQSALPAQECPAFDSYLATNPNIRLTMYIPLNCAIVVEVYRSCQQSGHPPPRTTTELYTCLVQTILLRYLDSHPDYKDDTIDVNKFTDLPPPVYQHFYKLIQMAYDGVLSQQLTFHDQHTALQHLGFMDSVMELFSRPTKLSATCSYNFLHLSLQEYLAAYFISLQSVDVQQQVLQTACKEQHLKNMGRFVAGITKYQGMDRATVKAVIEQECKKDDYDSRLELSSYTLQLLHESGDYSIIDGHPSYYSELTDYSALLDFAVLGHCIANSSYKWALVLGDYMQSTDRITMLVQSLKSHSNPRYTIEYIRCVYDAPECVQCLLLELPQHALQCIQELVLVSNSDNPHPLPLSVLEHILSKMSRLHELRLYHGAVSTTGAVAMAELIKNNNTLQYVVLYYNAIGVEGVEALKEIRKKDLKLKIIQ